MKTTKISTKHDLTSGGSAHDFSIAENVVAVQFSLHVINNENVLSRISVHHLNSGGGIILAQSFDNCGEPVFGNKMSHIAYPTEIGSGSGNQTKTLRFINNGAVNGGEPSKVELIILSETTV